MKINASTCALIVCAVSVITPTHSKQISAQASVTVVSSAPTLKALSEMAFPTIQKPRMSGKLISTHPIEYSQDRKIATVKTKDNLQVSILHGQANSNINIQTSSIIKMTKMAPCQT